MICRPRCPTGSIARRSLVPDPGYGSPSARHLAPDAVRAAGSGHARPALRRTRVPGGRPELPGDVRLGGAGLPIRNQEADGRGKRWVDRGQPWFAGRLAPRAPSYLGLTQWAITEDAPSYLKAMALDVTASQIPRRRRLPVREFRPGEPAHLASPARVPGTRLGKRPRAPSCAAALEIRAANDVLPIAELPTSLPSVATSHSFRTRTRTRSLETAGGIPLISGDNWRPFRPRASSVVGTTSSCPLGLRTIGACGRPAGRSASPWAPGRTSARGLHRRAGARRTQVVRRPIQ